MDKFRSFIFKYVPPQLFSGPSVALIFTFNIYAIWLKRRYPNYTSVEEQFKNDIK